MSYVHTGFAGFMMAVMILVFTLECCRRHGSRWIRNASLTRLEHSLTSIGLGLVLFGMGVYAAGSTIGLRPEVIMIYLSIFAVLAFIPGIRPPSFKPSFRWGWTETFLCLPLVLSLWQCGKPPIGNDALSYHLSYPRIFLETHRIAPIIGTRESLWPFLTEMYFTAGLFLQGTSLAQMFHWVFYVLTALGVYAWAARYVSLAAARGSLAIFVFTPAAFAQSSDAYVDLSIAFFVLMAYAAYSHYEDQPRPSWAAVSGIFCGAALSTKYLAMGLAGAMLILWAIRSRRSPKHAVVFALCAAAVSAVWYLRSFAVMGNPVYPFMADVFGGRGFDFGIERGVGMGKGLASLVGLPWNLAMDPEAFGGPVLGPAFVLFGPAGLWTALRSPKWRAPIFLGLAGALFIFFQAQQARFFLSVLALASLIAGLGVDRFWHAGGLRRRAVITAMAVLLVIHGGLFMYRTAKDGSVVLSGHESARTYLVTRERSYQGHEFLASAMKPGEKAFVTGETRRFYQEGPDVSYDDPGLIDDLKKSGRTLVDHLRDERFDWIWISEDTDPAIRGLLAEEGYEKAFEYDFTETPARFHHEIYRRGGVM